MGCHMSKKKEYTVKYVYGTPSFKIYKNKNLYSIYNYHNHKNISMNHMAKELESGLNKNELNIIKIKNSNNLNCKITIKKKHIKD